MQLLTFLLANVPAHVSPSFSLNASTGFLLMICLLTSFSFFFFPLLPSSVALPLPFCFGAVLLSSSCWGVGVGLEKADGNLSSKVPNQTYLMMDLKLRRKSLMWLHWVSCMHSLSQIWKGTLITYMNLLQKWGSVCSLALNACLFLSSDWMREVIACEAQLNWPKNIVQSPWK
jgi:hypothetical protein